MDREEMEEFIEGLNESVNFLNNSNMILSIKKTKDSEPRTVRLTKAFKYGKMNLKIEEFDPETRISKNKDSGV